MTWRLDPLTLGVRSAEVRLPGGAPIALLYRSYREVDGRYFPEKFEMIDPGASVRVEGVLREIELDAPWTEGDPAEASPSSPGADAGAAPGRRAS